MERGDIWLVDLEPTRGREQADPRPVLILTTRSFNRLGTPIVAPIATVGTMARVSGFGVSLMGAGNSTTGIVLCHQIRSIDLKERGARFLERAPAVIIEDVLARVAAIFE